ncbi:TIGR04372 family glycosyltransferase [Arcobacter sp. FWKO B]|uniref:TIGR04372 family glycosyltransferase n=1 Tax=Arcobacter sp. FWKO B TaxID=2593672 RepID=UPI00190371B5|nr:TIGR04372 family glycosyltransferase [Arcobacter sp. FWKO B]
MKLLGFHNKFNAIPSTYHIWECNKYASNIFFSEEDIKSLEKSLQELQLNDKIFICVHNRDSSYKKNFMPSLDWSFQNFRNSNPKNYIKSIDYFANQSIYTLRMGKGVEESLKIEDQYYFEYASSKYQSEFLDIALFYKCKFYIVSNTGVNAIGPLFRKPGVFVNFLPIEMETWQYFSYGSVILPKKILIKSTNKLMTFSQIWNIESHMGGEDVFLNALKDHFGDVEFIENTEEDILQAAIQMNLFIDDGYVETKEELELQKRFWSLGNSKEDVEKILFEYKYRISNKFLKDNIDLIC